MRSTTCGSPESLGLVESRRALESSPPVFHDAVRARTPAPELPSLLTIWEVADDLQVSPKTFPRLRIPCWDRCSPAADARWPVICHVRSAQ